MSLTITHKHPLCVDDVRRIREKLGLSPRQLAELMGTSRRNVYRWEDGATVPPLAVTVLHLLDERPDLLELMRRCAGCEREG